MKFQELLERLTEMFPRQDYQSRLERYIVSKNPKTSSEIEHWQKQFQTQEHRGLSL